MQPAVARVSDPALERGYACPCDLDNAVGSHHVEEGAQLAFLAGYFKYQAFRADINDLCLEYFGNALYRFAVGIIGTHLHKEQFACDGIRKFGNAYNIHDLGKLFFNLPERVFIPEKLYGHAGNGTVFGFAYR